MRGDARARNPKKRCRRGRARVPSGGVFGAACFGLQTEGDTWLGGGFAKGLRDLFMKNTFGNSRSWWPPVEKPKPYTLECLTWLLSILASRSVFSTGSMQRRKRSMLSSSNRARVMDE
jgi:hypothetical protein